MRIITARLNLREFTPEDWPDVLAYQRDPRYLQYYRWTDRTEAEVREFVQTFIDQQWEQPRRKFQLAMTFPDGGRVVGNCGIRRKPGNDWEADIGYELAPEHWGRGYATEATLAIVAFGFRDLRLHRISAECYAENTASAKVLEKVGMRLEGRTREAEYFKGRWWDMLHYGMIRGEWSDASGRR